MEVQRVSDSSIKIKAKNATFIIDPTGKIDTESLVFTSSPSDYSTLNSALVISGPGEYETAGVSIKGESHLGKTAYDFLEENQKILVTTATSLTDIKEMEDYAAIVVIADQALGEALSEVAAELILVVSPDEFLPSDRSTIKKIDKVNLKKTEEYKGFIVH